jgi:hypothetical protein
MEKKNIIKELEDKARKWERMVEINRKSFLKRKIRTELYIAKAMEAGIAPPTEEEVEKEYQKRISQKK